MHDKVQLLQRLRWGEVGFANLRHKGFEVWLLVHMFSSAQESTQEAMATQHVVLPQVKDADRRLTYCLQDWDCGSPHEKKAFPCGWEGAVMTPRTPFSDAFQQQPQSAAVSRMAMNMHKYWKIFFQNELGPLPELVYTQVTHAAVHVAMLDHRRHMCVSLCSGVNTHMSSSFMSSCLAWVMPRSAVPSLWCRRTAYRCTRRCRLLNAASLCAHGTRCCPSGSFTLERV
jgi:hypothetical protein